CTSASFSNTVKAAAFASQLTGKPAAGFEVVTGELDLRSPDDQGTVADAELLAAIDLGAYHRADSAASRVLPLRPFFEELGIASERLEGAVASLEQLEQLLFGALSEFAPMNR